MIKLYHPGTQVVADEDNAGTFVDAEFGRSGHHEGKYTYHGCNDCHSSEVESIFAVFFHVLNGL